MIRTLIAASLILGAGSAYAQDRPSFNVGAASSAQALGATASPGVPYGDVRQAPHHTVEVTGSVAPRASRHRAMGLPGSGPGSF